MAANRFELLATWYLRFNGYFTTPNFTVHPDYKKKPGGTDADILAVRFPFSRESQRRFQFDRDARLANGDRVDFVIAEVKTGNCELNQTTWLNPTRKNVEYALCWMGFETNNEVIAAIAKAVYSTGGCESTNRTVRFVVFGEQINEELRKTMPLALQLKHIEILQFLKDRFSLGCLQPNREHWDDEIQEFAKMSSGSSVRELHAWAKRE